MEMIVYTKINTYFPIFEIDIQTSLLKSVFTKAHDTGSNSLLFYTCIPSAAALSRINNRFPFTG